MLKSFRGQGREVEKGDQGAWRVRVWSPSPLHGGGKGSQSKPRRYLMMPFQRWF